MFGNNPKSQVVLAFTEFFGDEIDFQVVGRRSTPRECKKLGIPAKSFIAEIVVNDEVISSVNHKDWRKAYKMLKIKVENLFADGVRLV